MDETPKPKTNFIRDIIDEHLRNGRFTAVHTRFPTLTAGMYAASGFGVGSANPIFSNSCSMRMIPPCVTGWRTTNIISPGSSREGADDQTLS